MEATTNSLQNVTGNVSNVTYERNEHLAEIEIVVQSVIFVLAVLGNGIVLLTLLHRKKLSRMQQLMAHLSVADLFVAFGSVLPQLAWDVTFVFQGGDFLCRIVKFMQIMAIYASSYVLVVTAVDRYLAICFPFQSHKYGNRFVHIMIIAAWTVSLILSVPQIFIFSYKPNSSGVMDCWGTFEPEWTLTLYITTFTILVYIIPTLILMFCYINICIAVWKSANIGNSFPSIRFKHTPSSPRRSDVKASTIDTNSKCMISIMDNHTDEHTPLRTEEDVFLSMKNENNCSLPSFDKQITPLPHVNGLSDPLSGQDNYTHSCTYSARSRIDQISSLPLTTGSNHAQNEHQTDATQSNNHNLNNGWKQGLPACEQHPPNGSEIKKHQQCLRKDGHGKKRQVTFKENLHAKITRTRGQNRPHGITGAKLKTIKLTLTVVVCYLACWSPFFIAQMWAVYDETAPYYGAAYTIILLLASLNSCTNPWIYLVFSDSVCLEFKTFFSKFRKR